QDVPAARVLEVEGEGLLGAVEPDEVAGLTVHGGVVAAGGVAAARPLHLDHPGAAIGALAGGGGGGPGLLQTDHRDARQRVPLRSHASRSPGTRPPRSAPPVRRAAGPEAPSRPLSVARTAGSGVRGPAAGDDTRAPVVGDPDLERTAAA